MKSEDIKYCLHTLANFEPDDIDSNDIEIAVNDDQFATMGITRIAQLGHDEIVKLQEEVKSLSELKGAYKELLEWTKSMTSSEYQHEIDKFEQLLENRNG